MLVYSKQITLKEHLAVLWFSSTAWQMISVRQIESIRDFAFFVFERTKHQPRRNLRSYLVLQRLCNEAALTPALMHFGTRSWSKMVVSWRYANLSTELSRKFCVATA